MPEIKAKPPEPLTTPSPETPKQNGGLKDVVAVVIACLALLGFGVFVLALFFMLDRTELSWARATFLFTGVEALAFAGAGYLFGREVNRGRAENAEGHAESEAKRANKAEAQGEALAEEIRGFAYASRSDKLSSQDSQDTDRGLQQLAVMAEALFPSRGSEVRR